MAQTDRQGRSRGSGVTHEAIETIRELIASGEWGPGTRLPREADLAAQLGLSRNSLREAVRALSLARVLEVRQGDGTYVSSLEASELLEPTSLATNLLQGRTVLELFEVRRMLEPEAAALAALRADDADEGGPPPRARPDVCRRRSRGRARGSGRRVPRRARRCSGQCGAPLAPSQSLDAYGQGALVAWHGRPDGARQGPRRAHEHLRRDRRGRRGSRPRRDVAAHRHQ